MCIINEGLKERGDYMKQYFYFYFDDNDQLVCLNSYNGLQRTLDHKDTKLKLDYIDNIYGYILW